MNKQIIVLVIFILMIILIFETRKKTYEFMDTATETDTVTDAVTSLTDIDIEALQNLSSMYNSGTVTVTNIKATGNVDITGDLSVGNVPGTLNVNKINITSDLDVGGNLNVTGIGNINSDFNVSGTTKTTGPTYSKYYVINSKNSSTSDISEINSLVTPNSSGARTASGVIYSNAKANLGIKTGAHLYLTTYNTEGMIDIFGGTNSVKYYGDNEDKNGMLN